MPLSTFPNPQTGLSGSAMGYLLHWKNAEQWGHVIWNLCIHLCIANRPSQHYNQIRSEHYESQQDNQTGINYGTTLIHPTTNHLEHNQLPQFVLKLNSWRSSRAIWLARIYQLVWNKCKVSQHSSQLACFLSVSRTMQHLGANILGSW